MAKRAELFDGTILEFEDGTPADVIDRVAAEETDKRRSAEARVDLPAGVEPSTAGPGRGGLGGRPDAVPGNGLASARPARAGTMRAVVPYGANEPAPVPEPGQRSVFDNPTPIEDTPDRAFTDQQMIEMEKAPHVVALENARERLSSGGGQSATATPLTVEAGQRLREATGGGGGRAVQGTAAGFGDLGKWGTGMVAGAADLLGADEVSKFALGAAQKAGAFSEATTGAGGGYYDKLVQSVFSSTVQSLPTMMFGLGGATEIVAGKAVADKAAQAAMTKAMGTLYVQSAAQEYSDARNQGFEPGESAARAGIIGAAEVLGERFGFSEQMAVLRAAIGKKKIPAGQLGKVWAAEVMKEVPGEELTTAIEFLAAKYGPAAANPRATLEDYFQQAADTAVQTVGQTALMGAPAMTVQTYRRADDAAIAYANASLNGFKVDPPFNTDDAVTRRSKTIGIFENLAAQYGIPADVVSRATKTAKDMPAEKVGPFLAALVDRLQQRNLAPAVDSHAIDTLTAGPIDDPKVIEQQAKDAEKAAAASKSEQGATSATSATNAPEGTDSVEKGPKPSLPTDSVEKGPKPSPGEAAKAVSNIESILAPKTPEAAASRNPTIEEIDAAAHEASTSHLNDLKPPSNAQKEEGNYQKGHIRIDGMGITFENAKGTKRTSKADAEAPWEVTMPAHYGYIKGTVGADTVDPSKPEQVDITVGAQGANGRYFVINQNSPDGKKFDEHKVFTGVDSPEEAVALYKQSFTGGFGEKVFGSISQEFTADQLKAKLPSMSKAKPVLKPVANRETQVAKRETQIAAVDSGPRIIGRAGNTPTAATPIELRANPDGTLTPFHGGHELLDFESGQPIVLPVGVTDAQAVEAIKAAKSFGRKVKFYDAKEEPAAPTEEKPNAQAVRSDEGQVRQGGQEGQPGVQRGPEQGGGDLQQQAQGQPGDVAAGKPAEAAPARPEPSPKKVTPLTDAEAFASDYAAFDGKVIEQKVPLSDTSEPGVLRIDAANAMRAIDKRMDALEKLKTCLAKAA